MRNIFSGRIMCNVNYNPHKYCCDLSWAIDNFMLQRFREAYPSFWTTVLGEVPYFHLSLPNSFKSRML